MPRLCFKGKAMICAAVESRTSTIFTMSTSTRSARSSPVRSKGFHRGDIIIDLDRRDVEAILPRSEQARHERFSQGERIQAVIINVHKRKGPQVEVSRTSLKLQQRVFEMEVPEIGAGTVLFKSAARAPGERAKIAVMSTERGVALTEPDGRVRE